MPLPQLPARILTAFKQAEMENRLDVADHLLQALETLCSDEATGSPLVEAYMSIVERCEVR